MYTQRNKTKNNSEAQRAGLLGFSVSSNCSPFGVPICFLKKKLFFFCKRVQETICQISGRPASCVSGRTGHFFDSVPFLFSQGQGSGPKMGLLCLGLLSSVEDQGSHVGNPSAHTFGEVELFSPLQADSAAGRSVVWPCTLPCSRPCSMPRVCMLHPDFVSVAGSCTSESCLPVSPL